MQAIEAIEECSRFIDGHFQHLRDIFPFEVDCEGSSIESPTIACGAGDVDIFEEAHLQLQSSLACTGFASTGTCVEAEPSRRETSLLGISGGGKNLSDVIP
jgi:hypothetical protein